MCSWDDYHDSADWHPDTDTPLENLAPRRYGSLLERIVHELGYSMELFTFSPCDAARLGDTPDPGEDANIELPGLGPLRVEVWGEQRHL